MIILIDDKIKRQDSYGWTSQRFEMFKDFFLCLTDYSFLDDDTVINDIFSPGNVVLFHESFFNEIDVTKKSDAESFYSQMGKNADEEKLVIVYFSGSKTTRIIDGNKAYMPVSVLYKNLEYYIDNYSKENSIEYLLWGREPNIERELTKRIEEANNAMTVDNNGRPNIPSSVFIARTQKNRLDLPGMNPNDFDSIIYINFKSTDPVSDELLHNYIQKRLAGKEYDAIFLPLCFGPTLSDYNGLRLAMHIRCTKSPNQLKPIYVYGVVDMLYLVDNEYFDIIKTKGVSLLNYSTNAIYSALENNHSTLCLNQDLLSVEVKKIRLNLPKNYIDSHSIANEWAIYRWAKTIDAVDVDIDKVVNNVETNLYFKYLNTIHPISSLNQLVKSNLIIQTKSDKNPKILLVDDEAEKGWYEIFCEILYDINHFDFKYLDTEFNEKSPEEIVKIVHDKIALDDIDIVILDFRLHYSDFFSEQINGITGYKVLHDIKNKINAGIQVVVLSATNKIWNWEALSEAGADAVVMKDNPQNNYDELSTYKTVVKFVNAIQECSNRLFLKQFYNNYRQLERDFLPRKNNKSDRPLPKKFVAETMKWFKLSCDLFTSGVSETNIVASFLFLFSVIENISNYVVVSEKIKDIQTNTTQYRFWFRGGGDKYLMKYNKNNIKTENQLLWDNPYSIPWAQKILNVFDYISIQGINDTIRELVGKRHDIIHPDATNGKKIVININDVITLHEIVFNGLIKL